MVSKSRSGKHVQNTQSSQSSYMRRPRSRRLTNFQRLFVVLEWLKRKAQWAKSFLRVDVALDRIRGAELSKETRGRRHSQYPSMENSKKFFPWFKRKLRDTHSEDSKERDPMCFHKFHIVQPKLSDPRCLTKPHLVRELFRMKRQVVELGGSERPTSSPSSEIDSSSETLVDTDTEFEDAKGYCTAPPTPFSSWQSFLHSDSHHTYSKPSSIDCNCHPSSSSLLSPAPPPYTERIDSSWFGIGETPLDVDMILEESNTRTPENDHLRLGSGITNDSDRLRGRDLRKMLKVVVSERDALKDTAEHFKQCLIHLYDGLQYVQGRLHRCTTDHAAMMEDKEMMQSGLQELQATVYNIQNVLRQRSPLANTAPMGPPISQDNNALLNGMINALEDAEVAITLWDITQPVTLEQAQEEEMQVIRGLRVTFWTASDADITLDKELASFRDQLEQIIEEKTNETKGLQEKISILEAHIKGLGENMLSERLRKEEQRREMLETWSRLGRQLGAGSDFTPPAACINEVFRTS